MGEVGRAMAPLLDRQPRISGGSTPTAASYHPECGLTEMRPGTYVFNDRNQIDMWAAGPGDCAVTVLSTVVSAPETGRAILDAGSKSLSADVARRSSGYGMLKEDGAAAIVKLNEEHGFLDLSQSELKLRVGDKVEVIPNHACATVNLFDEMTVVKNSEVLDTWTIAARGKVR
jgi:D-serine deaminase-like pyridoxal phosphate-dependent protein